MAPRKTPKPEFTARQLAFIREYPKDNNGTQAALRAGYAVKGINVAASQLLSNPKIRAEIDKLNQSAAQRCGITLDLLLTEYKRIALFDTRKLLDKDGNRIPLHLLDDDTARAISSVEIEDINVGKGEDRATIGQNYKVKASDKNKALTDLMKHLGGFEKDNEQQNKSEATALAAAAVAISAANITIKDASDIYKELSKKNKT